MPSKDPKRWAQNEDGTWRNIAGREEVEEEAAVAEESEPFDVREYEVTDEGGLKRDYSELTKPELQDELESRGLPTSGNKPELIERLEADDV